jgi:hypothetical protein
MSRMRSNYVEIKRINKVKHPRFVYERVWLVGSVPLCMPYPCPPVNNEVPLSAKHISGGSVGFVAVKYNVIAGMHLTFALPLKNQQHSRL